MEPHLSELTLGQLLSRCAQDHGDKPALFHAERTLTWSELNDEVDRVATLLSQCGVQQGDVIGFMMSKRPELVTGFFACARLGAIMAPVNFKLHPDHLRFQFASVSIRTVFVEKRFDALLKGLLPELPDPKRIVYVGEPGIYGETQYQEQRDLAVDYPEDESGPDTPVYYNYTSGTTGKPKGAVTTHRNIVFNGLTAFDTAERDGLGFDESHVFLSMFSVFAHPHEIFHRSLLCGGPFVVLDTLSPRVTAECIAQFKVSWMMAVPSFYEMLLDHADTGNVDMSSLRLLESGGAFVSGETLERLEERFSARFMPVWGSTETTGVAVALRPDRERRLGTTGKPVEGYSIRVVDLQGRDCPPGQVGEMLIRGVGVAQGYANNRAETDALFKDGWYHTQDLMQWTEEGFLNFVGRRSEMLKIGGIRVYPLEIEKVIKDHPQVRGVVVVRAEERVRGEVARAVVELREGATLTAQQLRQYCRDRMAVYKVPRIVEFWSEIPLLPNGKVDKKGTVAVPVDPSRDDR
jgi:acyl-CoA synthetase (AMP-forming)/AMP-acid ligase II